jgi:hypothetical protein
MSKPNHPIETMKTLYSGPYGSHETNDGHQFLMPFINRDGALIPQEPDEPEDKDNPSRPEYYNSEYYDCQPEEGGRYDDYN